MGTPGFAVPSLDVLVRNGYNVVGVVTATDKLAGRGNKQLLQSEVKKYCLEHGLKVLQPTNLKSPEFLQGLRALEANLQIIVAFRMLPEVVWNMPSIGTFNLHASLLPKYRGAAPINWAVMHGEKVTGVTTFFLSHEIDTGAILFQEKTPISDNETAGEVHDRLMTMGADLVLKTVKSIENGKVNPLVQDESEVTKAPKIFHETCEIPFDQPVDKVFNFIRGLSPYPTAWTIFEGQEMKIFKADKIVQSHDEAPGAFVIDDKKSVKIAAKGGFIKVLELQLPGKKRMEVGAFLNGYVGGEGLKSLKSMKS